MDINVLEPRRVSITDRTKACQLVPHLLVAPATESLRLEEGDLTAASAVGPGDQQINVGLIPCHR
jgi:hypothetical protein